MADMASTDWEVRLRAVEQARKLPRPNQRRLLTMACGDVSELVRIAAIEEMERLADATFRPALLMALSDRHLLVRAHAVISLVPLCTKDDISILQRHLARSRSVFRVTLLWALSSLGQAAHTEALLETMEKTRSYHEACMGARLVSTLKLDADTKSRVIAVLQSARDRFRSAAVDDAVTLALKRLERKKAST